MTIIDEENVSKLLEMEDLQEILNKWITTIQTSTKTIQRRRTKRPRKDIKGLKKIRQI